MVKVILELSGQEPVFSVSSRCLLYTSEKAVAKWVAANHHRAGACTHTLSTAKAMYLPVQDEENVKGVMGIFLEERRQIQEFKYGLRCV